MISCRPAAPGGPMLRPRLPRENTARGAPCVLPFALADRTRIDEPHSETTSWLAPRRAGYITVPAA
jgi:hypothetical protein